MSDADFRVLHRDEHVLVLDKPSGVSLLADRADDAAPPLYPRVIDWCRAHQLPKPEIVHRLDKGTSGVLVLALSRAAQRSLNRQFAAHTLRKTYAAVVDATLEPPKARIDLPLCPGRKGTYRVAGPREAIVRTLDGRHHVWRLAEGATFPDVDGPRRPHPSTTLYRVAARRGDGALVVLRPTTGRTHQLRVHLGWIGWPLWGDEVYGRHTAGKAPRLMLHAARLVVWADWLPRPRWCRWQAPWPAEFREPFSAAPG